jgi:phosphoglycolate phosphatase|tara:strand:- start:299 stop:943 length:645 start_codon:yes stop_codon:yes gene_type:complete
MKKTTKPSAIIFDFDDTLVDAKPVISKALEETFKEFNINKEDLKHIDFNLSLRDYFHDIFLDDAIAAGKSYYKNYYKFAENLQPLKYAKETLDFLYRHKIFTSIVSNKKGERLRQEINDKFNWQKYFVNIVGSGDAPEDKPSSLPAIEALKTSGLDDYSNVWFIGDSNVDLKTAENLGCKAILFGTYPIKTDVNIDFTVKSHSELLNLLEKTYA